eukprot:CAMPEP_0118814994 /NCGR_PEP_ID=MMETSP1162-20130426/3911_1 /TAXON_ID=33656 /ORGANISM="Phaeocystis Sp, Strain CCMP2710" /LENGTH=41 /DNA_ID= /DNA_START= /DNA_END= /DNA_ORIENTATION=
MSRVEPMRTGFATEPHHRTTRPARRTVALAVALAGIPPSWR